MASDAGDVEHERQPLNKEDAENGQDSTLQNTGVDPNQTAESLIRHTDETAENDLVSPYNVDPTMVSNAYENPYKETTDTTQNFIRRVPSSDLVPAPFKKFKHVLILAIIAAFSFAFTGFFAFRLARSAKMHHSKGLYGLAQRDSKKSVILSYISIALGFVLTIAFIIILATLT